MWNKQLLLSIFTWIISLLPAVLPSAISAQSPGALDTTCHFANGKWFDGETFENGSFYSVNGILTRRKPDGDVSCVVDLKRGYVVPPFAEAHIHSLSDPATFEDELRTFLAKGIFYVMVQDAIFEISPAMRAAVNRPDSIDVVYAEAALLPSWYDSVLDAIYKPLAAEGRYGASRRTLADLDGYVLFLIDGEEDLEAKWERILDKNRDVVKVLLAFSEEFEERKSRVDRQPNPGIEPALLPLIVQRAHASGRRVSVHVETAADFRTAVAAGADVIAHLPGWRIGKAAGLPNAGLDPWKLTPQDARMAAERGVVVVTTTSPKLFLPDVEENRPKFAEIHRSNLRLLDDHGVIIAIGSDNRRDLLPAELRHLQSLGVFDALTLLKKAWETTPQIVFPNRRIGHLREGFEASFLVLEGDPLADLESIEKIVLRVKQGIILESESPGGGATGARPSPNRRR